MSEIKRKSFVFYDSFLEGIECLPQDQQLEAFKAIANYGLKGIEPQKENNPMVYLAFVMAKPQINANNAKYENGKKGGRPKETEQEPINNQKETKTKPRNNQTKTEQEPNVNVNVNSNVNENLNENDSTIVEGENSPEIQKNEIDNKLEILEAEILEPLNILEKKEDGNPPTPLAKPRNEITKEDRDYIVELVKKSCESNGIAYKADKMERAFASNFFSQKFTDEALKSTKMNLEDFIHNIIFACTKLEYSKPVYNCVTLYNNRADIVFKAKQAKLQSQNKKQSRTFEVYYF